MNSDIVTERLKRTKRLERGWLVVCTRCTSILYEQRGLKENVLQISQEQLERFRQVKNLYFNKTKVPEVDNWQDWNDDEVWWHLVSQVITVGNSLPAEKFEKNAGLKGEVAYEKLIKMQEADQARTINRVLREVGTRYASSSISKCRKTVALVHNLKALQSKILLS